jgi:hypothetical protein
LEGDHEGLGSFSVFVLVYRAFWGGALEKVILTPLSLAIPNSTKFTGIVFGADYRENEA